LSYVADTIPLRTAFNTLLYVSSCIPAAASQLYKEHVFMQYKQPVNVTYLNLLLSVFEFVFCSILSPLVFELQGLGAPGKWTALYPSSKFSENFLDGLKCFFRTLSDDDQENKYYDDARCDFALGLAVFHAFSIIAVGVAVDKIVNAGATKVMYRGMSAGIVVAVLGMHAYDMSIPEFSYGPAIDGLNLACLIILILGSEVYHRVALKDLTFDTVYQEVHIESLYGG
jgi:CRT-like, chloroquine-resistance transporter-like